MTAPAIDGAAIRDGLAEVIGVVALARQMSADGALVDLSGLDRRVDGLCRAILALPRGEGRAFEAGLLALIDDLTELKALLAQRHAAIATDSAADTSPRAAASAYRRTQS